MRTFRRIFVAAVVPGLFTLAFAVPAAAGDVPALPVPLPPLPALPFAFAAAGPGLPSLPGLPALPG